MHREFDRCLLFPCNHVKEKKALIIFLSTRLQYEKKLKRLIIFLTCIPKHMFLKYGLKSLSTLKKKSLFTLYYHKYKKIG